MKVIINLEANGLKPTHIWCIVCKDIDTGERYVWKNPTGDPAALGDFAEWAKKVDHWIGHNELDYDLPVLVRHKLLLDVNPLLCTDTLIISKLADYSRDGHSTDHYAKEFGIDKPKQPPFAKFSEELVDYCVLLVNITEKIYKKYGKYINNPNYLDAINLEHKFQLVVNDLHINGFAFNQKKATNLLEKVTKELEELDKGILDAFPPREIIIREFTPKETKFGTISKVSVPRELHHKLHEYELGKSYNYTKFEPFNPSSHKQLIEVLHDAGWHPIDKTKTHLDTERTLNQLKRQSKGDPAVGVEVEKCYNTLLKLAKYGWKINENNLSTLPASSPPPAKLLAKRILLEARRRTLFEWVSLVCLNIKIEKKNIVKNICLNGGSKITGEESITSNTITDLPSKIIIEWLKSEKLNATFVEENSHWLWITITPPAKSEVSYAEAVTHALDGLRTNQIQYTITSERIRGKFIGLGAWTHRMAHQQPNTANIPNEFREDGSTKLLGKEMRSLWCAPKNRLLVGVDAEGIQLRIFAHYIEDAEFTDALVKGKKDDKTDPHSLNQRVLGSVCRSRQAAKRFIYALLLGAGINKLAEILGCTKPEAEEALNRLLERYTGFAFLKREVIPKDAKRGWFVGIDGRAVKLPGNSDGTRRHLCMSGYLQNGEAVIVKKTVLKTLDKIREERIDSILVNVVHDEVIFEIPNDVRLGEHVSDLFCRSIEEVGRELNLKCPLAGDGHVGLNWYEIH